MGQQEAEPMTFTPAQLQERTLHRRAIEAAIWGMPAVNYDAMHLALARDAKGASNQIVYWSRLLTWKNQTLTPNPDAIYLMPFYDTTDGPVILEIPPADDGSITGSIDDAWQCAIADVGPAGIDRGEGGKCLILPPDYQGSVSDGYLTMPSPTFCGYTLLRSNLKSGSDSDIAKAVAYGKRVKFYPLSDDAASTTFVDAADVLFDATIPYDASFFEALDRRVQAEPWLTRDKAMIDTLKAIGIEKGRPFAPDTATTTALTDAMQEAHAWLDIHYEGVFAGTFYDDARWALPAPPELVEATTTSFSNADSYPVDDRGVAYSWAFFSAKTVGNRPVLPDDHQRQGRRRLRRSRNVPPRHTPQRASEPVLVGHRLQSHHPHTHPRHAVGKPILEHTRSAHRGRRVSHSALRPRTAQRRREQLGPHPEGRPFRSPLPLLRAAGRLL
jgi:hypothetical protein